jgi:hypothetical protein
MTKPCVSLVNQMSGKKQFSLKWLFVEMTLVAILLALIRWVFFTDHADDSDLEARLIFYVGIPSGVACFGAVIGGLFGRWGMGAAWALLLLFLNLLAYGLFPPVQ